MVSRLCGPEMSKSAMILAAGLGLRMRPLTDALPKPLIPVAGKTMLDRTFEHVHSLEISRVVVNTHHLAPLLENHLNLYHPSALISHERILLETGGGIKKALPLLGKDAFFTLNGDNIWTAPESLKAMGAQWNNHTMDALLLLAPREKAHGYQGSGDFFISPQGRLTRPQADEKAPFVYVGIQQVHPRLFEHSPEGPFSMNILWDQAIQQNRLYGHIHQGDWFHISTPEDLGAFESLIS